MSEIIKFRWNISFIKIFVIQFVLIFYVEDVCAINLLGVVFSQFYSFICSMKRSSFICCSHFLCSIDVSFIITIFQFFLLLIFYAFIQFILYCIFTRSWICDPLFYWLMDIIVFYLAFILWNIHLMCLKNKFFKTWQFNSCISFRVFLWARYISQRLIRD